MTEAAAAPGHRGGAIGGDQACGDAAIAVAIEQRDCVEPAAPARYGELLSCCLSACGVAAPAEAGLAFVGIDEMTELNEMHMGSAGPTDVLAFPIDGMGAAPPGQPSLVGDIVICPDIAARAAQPLADELALLVVHGALHLLGHDHAEPDETAEMQRQERLLLADLWQS